MRNFEAFEKSSKFVEKWQMFKNTQIARIKALKCIARIFYYLENNANVDYTIFLTVQNQFEKLRVKFCAPIKIALGFSLATQPHYIWRSSGAYQGAFFHMLIAQFFRGRTTTIVHCDIGQKLSGISPFFTISYMYIATHTEFRQVHICIYLEIRVKKSCCRLRKVRLPTP